MSIKRLLVVASVALVVLLAASAILSLYVFAAAEGQLSRALRSYEQLAIATGLETDAARAMLHELQRRQGIDDVSPLPGDRDRAASGINALISAIRDEIGSIADPGEQAAEAEEFVTAFAIREDYARLFRALESGGDVALGADATARYRAIDARLSSVVAGERDEVAETIADLSAFRARLRVWSLVALAAVVLVIIAAAALAYRLLMKPLQVLGSGSAQLAAGNISHRIAPLGPPEFVRLAQRLNDMAACLEEQRNALHRSNELLEHTVAERTAQLADKAERLQKIDESRRLFLAKVGHELRTPLTVLLGETQVALQTPGAGSDDYRDALAHIAAHGDQLERRIADLMTLARSEDGRLSIQAAPVDPRALAGTTIAAARAYASVMGVQLQLCAGPALPAVTGDADRLRQALMALLDNAIKFSPADAEITLQVDCQEGELVFAVADRGPGVAQAELPLLTEPWFQGGGAPARVGTGLGLAVARWVAEQHGGSLTAANRAGGGLCVALRLPLVPPARS